MLNNVHSTVKNNTWGRVSGGIYLFCLFFDAWPCVYGLFLESIKPVTITNLYEEEMKGNKCYVNI